MDDLRCPICKRRLGGDPRAKFCSSRCRWRAYWNRSVLAADKIDELPLAEPPAEVEEMLPAGREQNLLMLQLAIVGRAPAGARGYRVGIKYARSQIQRWFPIARRTQVPMFLLEPFEWPAVPVAGVYAVVYLDVRCEPIGGPRFGIAIDQIDRSILYSEGDRTYKPRRG